MATSTARLEARISRDLHSLLKRAAALQDRTVTDFVVTVVREAAEKTVDQADVMRMTLADEQRFADALLRPPKPANALKRAVARKGKLLSS
jgi:uncharacterized protein (DUF1778 family)